MWRQIRNRQAPLPRFGNSGLSADRDRYLGQHVPAYRAEGIGVLQAFSIPLGLGILFQILVQNWEIAVIFTALMTLNLLAAHGARRAECPNRPAWILCAIYFSTIRSSRTGRARRRSVRLPVLFFFGFLLFFSLRIRFPVGHGRPPLVDFRRLYTDTNWDYLRENHFFREPPPTAIPPEPR